MEIIAILILYVGFISAGIFWKFKKDDFLMKESYRCLNKFCEIDSDWNSRGRIYTRGLTVIEENGEKRFVKQAKLIY